MKIFFAGTMRGGKANLPNFAEIIKQLERHGTITSRRAADQTNSNFGETTLDKEEIFNREMKALQESDILVAEVTAPSLGVGYEIAAALNLGKRVVCLYSGYDTYTLSAMIKGDKRIELRTYTKTDELKSLLQNIFANIA